MIDESMVCSSIGIIGVLLTMIPSLYWKKSLDMSSSCCKCMMETAAKITLHNHFPLFGALDIGICITKMLEKPQMKTDLKCLPCEDLCYTQKGKPYWIATQMRFPVVTFGFIVSRLIKNEKIQRFEIPIITTIGFAELFLYRQMKCENSQMNWHQDNNFNTKDMRTSTFQACFLIALVNIIAIGCECRQLIIKKSKTTNNEFSYYSNILPTEAKQEPLLPIASAPNSSPIILQTNNNNFDAKQETLLTQTDDIARLSLFKQQTSDVYMRIVGETEENLQAIHAFIYENGGNLNRFYVGQIDFNQLQWDLQIISDYHANVAYTAEKYSREMKSVHKDLIEFVTLHVSK